METIRYIKSLLLILAFIYLHLGLVQGQNPIGDSRNYNFASGQGQSLIDMSTGTQQLIGPNRFPERDINNAASPVTNLGFNFWMLGEHFDQFSVTANGVLRLGPDQVNYNANTPAIQTDPPIGTQARVAAITSANTDMGTSNTGKVHYKVTGAYPNRRLVVEWKNMAINDNNEAGTNLATFQLHLYETAPNAINGGRIYFVYGDMYANTDADISTRTGFGYGEDDYEYIGVDTESYPYGNGDLSRTGGVPENAVDDNDNRVSGLHTNNATNRRYLQFDPNPATGEVSNASATCQTATTVNLAWTDAAATNGYRVAVYRSTTTNDADFEFIGQVDNGTQFYQDLGLAEGTTYYYRFYLVNEGDLSDSDGTPVEVSVTTETTTGPTVYAINNGDWTTNTTWSTGAMPAFTDNVVVACGTTVTVDGSISCNNLVVQSGATLAYDNGGRAITVNGNLTNDGTLDISATGSSLNVNGNFTNGAGSTWIPGASTVTFSGAGTQEVRHSGESSFIEQTASSSYAGADVNIPDGNGFIIVGFFVPLPGDEVYVPLNITESGNITDVNVGVGVDHNRISDIEVYLRSPSGTVVELYNDFNPFCTSDDIDAVFDDEAATDVNNECGAPIAVSGNFRPNEALSAFDGENLNGEWRLYARDYRVGTTGAITDFSLDITYTDASTAPELAFNNLVMNNTGGGVQVINSDWLVYGNMTLTDGILYNSDEGNGGNGDHELIFTDNATSDIASNNSHVNGSILKRGNDQFTFPIGHEGWGANIGITAPGSVTDEFRVTYRHESPTTLYNILLKVLSLDRVSNVEYWDLERVSGSSAVRVALSYDNTRSGGTTVPTELRVAHWRSVLGLGLLWQDEGYGGAAGSAGFGFTGIVSPNPINSFSPFSLGSGVDDNPLPVELIGFEAKAQEEGVALAWETAQEVNSSHFVLERSANGVDFEEIGQAEAQGHKNTKTSYNWLDQEVNGLQQGVFYYRLKAVDLDNSYDYSKVKKVSWSGGISEFAIEQVYPNPFANSLSASLSIPKNSSLQYELLDALGRRVYENTQQATIGTHTLEIPNVSTLPKGIYILRVSHEGKVFSKKLVKK